jgi:Cu(I)/Ag(I) efflux system protein CusF
MSYVKNIVFFSMLALSAISAQTVVAAETDATASPSSASTPSEGEVRKIDKDAGKLTIKHGALENLGMPAMTMVFKAKDTAMLDSLKVGDKISFIAEKVDGQITVTKIDVRN